jgi:hypothetical protein
MRDATDTVPTLMTRSCTLSMAAFASASAPALRLAVPSIIVTASISCITPSCSSPAMRIRSCSCAFINRWFSALISRSCRSTIPIRIR